MKTQDLMLLGKGVEELYQSEIINKGLPPLDIRFECGRMVTGPYGWLVSKVLHKKETLKVMLV